MPLLLIGNLVGAALVYGFILRSPLGIGLRCAVGAGAALGYTEDPLALILSGIALAAAILLRVRGTQRARAGSR